MGLVCFLGTVERVVCAFSRITLATGSLVADLVARLSRQGQVCSVSWATIRIGLEGAGGILVNGATKAKIPYLYTKEEYQDVKVHLEFTVPKRSASLW